MVFSIALMTAGPEREGCVMGMTFRNCTFLLFCAAGLSGCIDDDPETLVERQTALGQAPTIYHYDGSITESDGSITPAHEHEGGGGHHH